jgi:hypothetical protein
MKSNTASLSVLVPLVITALLLIGILKIQQAYAQVATTSADSATTSLSTETSVPTPDASTTDLSAAGSPPVLGASTSAAPTADAAPSSTESTPPDTAPSAAATTSVSSVSAAAPEAPPQGLTLVHIIGTKYIDYFTDGSTTVSFPGDDNIDANLDKPDAPIPTHEGMTWVHTTGQNLYDTPSGDLETGDYAIDANGTRLEKPFPTTFVSSTSTAPVSDGSTPSAPTADTTSTSSPTSDSSTTTDQSELSAPPTTDTTTTSSSISQGDSSTTSGQSDAAAATTTP